MIRYYERVPQAAVRSDETGPVAYGLHKLITLADGRRAPVRMRRSILHRVAYVKNGEAYLSLGRAADAKGVTSNLPFAVSWQHA
ncbi:MAG: hypothetical protein AB1704_20865 [Pseudomonadota bacterium]